MAELDASLHDVALPDHGAGATASRSDRVAVVGISTGGSCRAGTVRQSPSGTPRGPRCSRPRTRPPGSPTRTQRRSGRSPRHQRSTGRARRAAGRRRDLGAAWSALTAGPTERADGPDRRPAGGAIGPRRSPRSSWRPPPAAGRGDGTARAHGQAHGRRPGRRQGPVGAGRARPAARRADELLADRPGDGSGPDRCWTSTSGWTRQRRHGGCAGGSEARQEAEAERDGDEARRAQPATTLLAAGAGWCRLGVPALDDRRPAPGLGGAGGLGRGEGGARGMTSTATRRAGCPRIRMRATGRAPGRLERAVTGPEMPRPDPASRTAAGPTGPDPHPGGAAVERARAATARSSSVAAPPNGCRPRSPRTPRPSRWVESCSS